MKATTTASHQIKAILVGADEALRDAMKVQSLLELATRASNLVPLDGQHLALVSLGRRLTGSNRTSRSWSSTR